MMVGPQQSVKLNSNQVVAVNPHTEAIILATIANHRLQQNEDRIDLDQNHQLIQLIERIALSAGTNKTNSFKQLTFVPKRLQTQQIDILPGGGLQRVVMWHQVSLREAVTKLGHKLTRTIHTQAARRLQTHHHRQGTETPPQVLYHREEVG